MKKKAWEDIAIPSLPHSSQKRQESQKKAVRQRRLMSQPSETAASKERPGLNGYFHVPVDAVRQLLAQLSRSLAPLRYLLSPEE